MVNVSERKPDELYVGVCVFAGGWFGEYSIFKIVMTFSVKIQMQFYLDIIPAAALWIVPVDAGVDCVIILDVDVWQAKVYWCWRDGCGGQIKWLAKGLVGRVSAVGAACDGLNLFLNEIVTKLTKSLTYPTW